MMDGGTGVPDDEDLWHLVPRERLNKESDDEGVNVVDAECAAEMSTSKPRCYLGFVTQTQLLRQRD